MSNNRISFRFNRRRYEECFHSTIKQKLKVNFEMWSTKSTRNSKRKWSKPKKHLWKCGSNGESLISIQSWDFIVKRCNNLYKFIHQSIRKAQQNRIFRLDNHFDFFSLHWFSQSKLDFIFPTFTSIKRIESKNKAEEKKCQWWIALPLCNFEWTHFPRTDSEERQCSV
jgi:hypothetical protein